MRSSVFSQFLFVLVLFVGTSEFASGASPVGETYDLVGDNTVFIATVFTGLQNPLLGAGVSLELRKLFGFLELEGSASGGGAFGLEERPDAWMALGGGGFRADFAGGIRFLSGTSRWTYFYAVNSYSSGYNQRTYEGYNLPYSEHIDHYLQFATRLENTGIFQKATAVNPLTSSARYELNQGYSLFLHPRYVVKGEHRFSLSNSKSSVVDEGFWSFAVGPAFTAIFSQYGAIAELSVVKDMGGGLLMTIKATGGMMIRNSLPDGYEWWNGDAWKPTKDSEGTYYPMALTVGISLPVVFGRKN